jgi:hypothetical protein
MICRRSLPALIAMGFLLLAAAGAPAQGLQPDEGQCTNAAGKTVPSCWNFQAGRALPESLGAYPEFLPFLTGWDFRINLPHIRLQRGLQGAGGPPAMAGVVEDATAPSNASGTLAKYGHTNNTIWLMRVQEADRRLYVKALPSRRDGTGSATENVTSLTAGWTRAGGPGAPGLRVEKPAAAVVGAGIGSATIVIVARRESDAAVLFTERRMTSTTPDWSRAGWGRVGGTSSTPVSAVTAFGDRVAVAWRDSSSQRIRVRLYSPATSTWGPVADIAGPASGAPQLVWDGAALSLFFVDARTQRLQHTLTTSADPRTFRDRVEVAPTGLIQSFHALAYNGRLHVAFAAANGFPIARLVRYTVSRVPAGQRSSWTAPGSVGFGARSVQLAPLRDTLFAIGVGSDGRLRFARRDNNVLGPEATGTNVSGMWLTPGTLLDPSAGHSPAALDTVFFNSDVYLATADSGGVRVMNASRAATKQLITGRWGIGLRWGEAGGGPLASSFARGEEIPLVGDVDADGKDDLLRFTQRAEPGAPAPVYVATAASKWETQGRWHPFFSLKGEIPLVGNFDGRGGDDIVTFVQKRQLNADGSVLGTAPVWVALSDGTKFNTSRVWHRFFSLMGEIPLVGDFNGDDRDDIVTFVQKRQLNGDGSVLGTAPVWVALSDGTKFNTSRVWHRFFSLKGEIPMVGDFNGDGKDDIATFVQQRQLNADGSVLGTAPVWVSLSDGTKFGPSRVWHTFFSPRGEMPAVGDTNLDGRDDIVTFLHDRVSGSNARAVFTAASDGSRFGRSTTWASDYARKDQIPQLASLSGRLSAITGRPQDADRRPLDLVAFNRSNGSVSQLRSMAHVPFPSGAPWERYKWFTDKGHGVGAFPEWIFRRPGHCVAAAHRFALLGQAGTGGADVTNLSVRTGSRAGHVMEELGHSTFANCFRRPDDPLNAAIFTSAGLDAEGLHETGARSGLDCGAAREQIAIPFPEGGSGNFNDCRDGEHYFLGLLNRYRLYGDEFRQAIRTTQEPGRQARMLFQYRWLRDHWFGGAEYKRGPAMNASLPAEGMLCVPNECSLAGVPQIVLRPASVSFGIVAVGDSVERTVRIENAGQADVVVSIAPPPVLSSFQWSRVDAARIAPGQSIALSVEFAPRGSGAATRSLIVRPTEGGPSSLALRGTGTQETEPR